MKLKLYTCFVMAITAIFVCMGTVPTAFAVDPTVIPGYSGPAPDNATSIQIEGCNLDKDTEGTYNPTGTPGVFYCDTTPGTWPATDDSYTDGNLGKQWEELDLVPHRIGIDTSGSAGLQTYQIIIGADNLIDTSPTKIGYDLITKVVLRDDLSTGSSSNCALSLIGGNQTGAFGIGGAIEQIVQILEITQEPDTYCVFDYVEQLAITSSLISGSSNRSFVVAGTGAQSIPIPSDISPQELSKEMSAVENSILNWTLEKAAAPVTLDFGNTCETEEAYLEKDVTVTITFTKGDTEPTSLAVASTAQFVNPSSRDVKYDCEDILYSDDTAINTVIFEQIVEPGMLNYTIEHVAPPGTRQLRDELTCSLYVENILDPGTYIPVGTLTAEFALPDDQIAPGETVNETVVVSDDEIIAGADFDFAAVQEPTGVVGFFDGYTPGVYTVNPVGWTSETQADGGIIEFTKTVRVKSKVQTTGTLSDTATIPLSEVADLVATANTDLSTNPLVDLTIVKTIPDILQGEETVTFDFGICRSDSSGVCIGGGYNVLKTVTFIAGETSKSLFLDDLDPGYYKISEVPSTGWTPLPDQLADLNLPICDATLTFDNLIEGEGALAQVRKVTIPPGFEGGWEFTLNSCTGTEEGNECDVLSPIETLTTTDATFALFSAALQEGKYKITETEQAGWILTGSEGCEFDVNFPDDNTAIFECTYTNAKPTITLTKTGDELSKTGDLTDYTITLTNTSLTGTPDLTCTVTDGNIGVSETVVLGAGDSHTITASAAIPDGASDPYVNTTTAECTNGSVTVTADASHSVNLFQPEIALAKTGDALSKIGDLTDYTITLNNTSSTDTPDLTCTITDAALGVDETVTLAAGGSHVIDASAAIPDGASDPYVNTASVLCTLADFPNELSDEASHSVELFQPKVTLTKTGDELGKAGDSADYTITLNNASSTDTPDLTCTITDGDIGVSETVVLAAGGSHVINASAPIPVGAGDPYVNTASVECKLDDFPNVLTASDDHSVNLFQPSITFDKSGDTLSKIGDPTAYVITLNNTSSTDTPDLTCTVTDTAIGVNETVTLGPAAAPYVINASAAIPAGASDPYLNTASVSCSVAGFSNVLTASDGHSVNLFQPSITLAKTGDTYSKVGDPTDYTITLTRTSSGDTPAMICTVTDAALGVNETVTLGPGAAPKVINATAAIPAGASDPYVNTAIVSCSVTGFPNVLSTTASHSVILLEPALTVTKDCTNEPVPQEGPATYSVTFENTGDADLVVTADDDIGEFSLPAGASESFEVSLPGPFEDQAEVPNTVNASWKLDPKYGLPNTGTAESTATCRVGSRVNLLKKTQGVVDPSKSWTFNLYSGPDGFGSGELASNNTSGDADGVLEFDNVNLDPLKTYTICELAVPAGYSTFWQVDADGDGVADTTVIPYNPNGDDIPPEDLGNRCMDFGADTGIDLLTAGGTLVFEVNNQQPGGAPRTPGYWKNWNTCTGGGQQYTADANGGWEEGFWLLEDVLDPNVGGGIVWDDILSDATEYAITDCEIAVLILDKRRVQDGKKDASDPLVNLATHLLAAQLNFGAGACTTQEALDAALAAEQLLDAYDFPLGYSYKKKELDKADASLANELAGYLDAYNNGMFCGDGEY